MRRAGDLRRRGDAPIDFDNVKRRERLQFVCHVALPAATARHRLRAFVAGDVPGQPAYSARVVALCVALECITAMRSTTLSFKNVNPRGDHRRQRRFVRHVPPQSS